MTDVASSAAPQKQVPDAVHATAVAVGEAGILIRGVSGAGKSRLALATLAEAGHQGLFARLICDDRVRLSLAGGRLLAKVHPAIAGRIEGRGEGILDIEHEAAAVIRAVVDLVDPQAGTPSRLPDSSERTTEIGGVCLPRLSLRQDRPADEAAQRILAFLGKL